MPFRSALLTNQNCVLDAMFTNFKFDAHQRGESIAIKHNVFTEKNENGKRNLKKIFYFATVPLYGKTDRPPSSDPVCVCTDYCQRQQSSFKVNLKKKSIPPAQPSRQSEKKVNKNTSPWPRNRKSHATGTDSFHPPRVPRSSYSAGLHTSRGHIVWRSFFPGRESST